MLETILRHLHNWFVVPDGVHSGAFSVNCGALDCSYLRGGQYYRIIGSVFNDGLHRYGIDVLTDEQFSGEVWALAVPRSVINLADEIKEWRANNPETAFQSESFNGYSYSRAASASGAPASWEAVFRSRLNAWRKLP